MTLAVFPDLTGISIETVMRPDFKTTVFEALSGAEARIGFRQYPKTTFKIPVNVLVKDQNEESFITLWAFFCSVQGMLNPFLYQNPDDYTVTGQVIGIGDGSNADFQFSRTLGGINEAVFNKNDATVLIYVDNVLQELTTDYTLPTLTPNLVSFVIGHEPADNAVITCDMEYYYRCRFLDDGYDFNRIDVYTHECPDLQFIGSLRNMV